MLSRYNASLPLKSDYLKNIFKELRDFKANFKGRFELNHNMDGILDTTDGDCDGYHKKLDMPACDYDAEVLAGTIPEIADDTTYGVLHCREIDSVVELCFKNNAGTWQITDKGYIATDVTVWDDKSINISNLYLRDIAYGNNIFVAVGNDSGGGSSVYTSTDLINWTARLSVVFYDVIYANGLFVASGSNIYTSPDGITWTLRHTIPDTGRGLCFADGLFVATANSIYTSPDGITWTTRLTLDSGRFRDVVYGDGLFVAAGSNIYTSPDGITWTLRFTVSSCISLAYGKNLFVVGTGSTNSNIYTSPDGITWTLRFSITGYNDYFYDLDYGNNKFIAVGHLGNIYSSEDGIIWEQIRNNSSDDLLGVSYVRFKLSQYYNIFLIVGGGGKILASQKYIEL